MIPTWQIRYADILKALGHPVRLCMSNGLMANPCEVGHIVQKLKLPQSTVSQHLAILRRQGIVIPERKGVRICYRVKDPKIKALIRLLKP